MQKANKGVIIYGILNWGLGHATRSVSIIKALQQEGYTVVIASDGQALSYLKGVFGELDYEKLPGYNITYGKGSVQLLRLALQMPRMAMVALKERVLLKKLVKKHRACGVISDNRLGFYSRKVPSVYITHQLHIMMPFNTHWASYLHHTYINKFSCCWVPDWSGANNLSGEFSHKLLPKIPVYYIGPQSQFVNTGGETPNNPIKYDLVMVLSGPEPQRSLLEQKLWNQIAERSGNFLLIRGTQNAKPLKPLKILEVRNMANAEEIKQAIQQAGFVISRSGYSSIMDYYFLKNRAMLIPTPGQPEQEYLARYQLSKGRFGYAAQDYLNLDEDLAKAKKYPGFTKADKPATSWSELFSLFESK